jgi:hypothetical protein
MYFSLCAKPESTASDTADNKKIFFIYLFY